MDVAKIANQIADGVSGALLGNVSDTEKAGLIDNLAVQLQKLNGHLDHWGNVLDNFAESEGDFAALFAGLLDDQEEEDTAGFMDVLKADGVKIGQLSKITEHVKLLLFFVRLQSLERDSKKSDDEVEDGPQVHEEEEVKTDPERSDTEAKPIVDADFEVVK